MAKQMMYQDAARAQLKEGLAQLAQPSKSRWGLPAQCAAAQKLGFAQSHQRRRIRQQGN